jgi:transposase
VHFDKYRLYFEVEKESRFEVCSKCAHASNAIYDHRLVRIKDAPLRNKGVRLLIRKRRFSCEHCKTPFTEYVPGIKKGSRTTQRYKSNLLRACEDYSDLERVRRQYRCSDHYLYKAFYEMLDLESRKRRYPWPRDLGIDEKSFRREKLGGTRYSTVFVDHKNTRVFEVADTRKVEELKAVVSPIEGPENVLRVTQDMSETYRSFVLETFPNAIITVDKFHVLRLLTRPINLERIKITGDKRKNPVRKLLLQNGKNLSFHQKSALYRWLENFPSLKELYHWKEGLMGFYRIRGFNRANRAFTKMTDGMALSKLDAIQTLRRTLMKWRIEILNYFKTHLTNARCEGFNCKISQVKLRAYGFKSFPNFRLRVLNACA